MGATGSGTVAGAAVVVLDGVTKNVVELSSTGDAVVVVVAEAVVVDGAGVVDLDLGLPNLFRLFSGFFLVLAMVLGCSATSSSSSS